MTLSSDCFGIQQEYSYRTWFFYSTHYYGESEKRITVTYHNYANQSRLYNDGYRIVYLLEELDYEIDKQYEYFEEFKWQWLNETITTKVFFNNK